MNPLAYLRNHRIAPDSSFQQKKLICAHKRDYTPLRLLIFTTPFVNLGTRDFLFLRKT